MSSQIRSTGTISQRNIVTGIVVCLAVVVLGYLGGRLIAGYLGADRAEVGPHTYLTASLGMLFIAFFVFAAVVALRLRRLAASSTAAPTATSPGLRITAVVFALAALFAAAVVFTQVVAAIPGSL
ncbi:hypothetical protein [Planctomonas psychrotolerans]|uniref:hypothetical protein n=1 Tax=Planctomonas psychrotolerans TaxID=2528712 RepID=UPI0012395D93|nr:hypothetical protein [Planctomonas psychrotolerans]